MGARRLMATLRNCDRARSPLTWILLKSENRDKLKILDETWPQRKRSIRLKETANNINC